MTTRKPLYASVPAPNPRAGQYTIAGERYSRVTTILGVISKPGLEAWRQKVGIAEAQRISQAAADFGTRFHEASEALDRDWDSSAVLTDYDAGLAGADLRPLVAAFLAWRDQHVTEVLAVERTIHHPVHRYAGTLDRLYRLCDGRVVVGDFKTGKTVDGIYRLQLMAYQEALEAHGEQVDGRLVLHLPSDRPGTLVEIHYDEEEKDRKAWRACLRLWRWHERHKNDWKGTAK